MTDKKKGIIALILIVISLIFLGVITNNLPAENVKMPEGNKQSEEPQEITLKAPSPQERISNILQANRDMYPGLVAYYSFTEGAYIIAMDQDSIMNAMRELKQSGVLKTDATESEILSNKEYYFRGALLYMAGSVVKTLYNEPSVNDIKVILYFDGSDDYGNLKSIKIASFEFNRALYEKINWDNFTAGKLPKVAPNFKYYEKI